MTQVQFANQKLYMIQSYITHIHLNNKVCYIKRNSRTFKILLLKLLKRLKVNKNQAKLLRK